MTGELRPVSPAISTTEPNGTEVHLPNNVRSRKTDKPSEKDLDIDYPRPGCTYSKDVGVDIPALVEAAIECLSRSTVPTIRIFDAGGFNKLFLLTFPEDGFEILARCPFPKGYRRAQMVSEISTMIFARAHLGLHVPRVYGWDVRAREGSRAQAPFILMERMKGVSISEEDWGNKLSDEQRMNVLDQVAALHVKLVQQLPESLRQVGNIVMKDFLDDCPVWADYDSPDYAPPPLDRFEVGPLVLSQQATGKYNNDVPIPTCTHSSIAEYWKTMTELQVIAGMKRWAQSLTKEQPYIIPEDNAGLRLEGKPQTVKDFVDAYRNLMAVIGAYGRTHPPTHVDQEFCLWHHDFALRNLLFEHDAGKDTYTLTGIIDWEDATIGPLAFAARSPNEFEDTNWIALDGMEGWVYFPNEHVLWWDDKDQLDPEGMITPTWWRFYYSGKVAMEDGRFCARFWEESGTSLMLKEIVEEGWYGWLARKKWLEKTARSLTIHES